MPYIVLNEFDVKDLKSKGLIGVKRLLKPQPVGCDTFLKSSVDYSFKFCSSYAPVFALAKTNWLEPQYKVNGTYWVKMSYMQLMAMVGSRDIYKQFFTTKKDLNLSVIVVGVQPILEENRWYWVYEIKLEDKLKEGR